MHTYENAVEHLGESQGVQNHDHDIVHELSRRLDSLWRYDQYLANAGAHLDLRAFWQKVKAQDMENVAELRNLLRCHMDQRCL